MNYQKQNHYNTYQKTAKPAPKNRFDKLFVLLAGIALLAPYPYFMLYGYFEGYSAIVALLYTAVLIAAGYTAQLLWAKLCGISRVRMDGTYENMDSMFSPKRAAGPLVLCVLIAVLAFIFARVYLRWRYNAGVDYYYDNNALFPFLIAPLAGVFAALGVIAWFFPAKMIVSVRMLIPAVANLMIAFLITKVIYMIDIKFFIITAVCGAVFVLLSYLLTSYYDSFMKT